MVRKLLGKALNEPQLGLKLRNIEFLCKKLVEAGVVITDEIKSDGAEF